MMKPPHRKSPSRSRSPHRSLRLVLPVAGLVLGGCDSLGLNQEPETARIRISSNDVSEVTLITSLFFVEMADPDCAGCPSVIQLIEGDTAAVSLPFDKSYPLNYRLQFFAEAYASAEVPVTLSMTAHVDDREWYNGSRVLQPEDDDGMPETIRFVYQYSRARLP